MSLRERKVFEKKRTILRTAMKVIDEKGIQATTIDDIAHELLMTKGSIYYYFKDKQDLLYQCRLMISNEIIEKIEAITEQDLALTDKLREMLIAHIEYLILEKSSFSVSTQSNHIFAGEQLKRLVELENRYERLFDNVLQAGVDNGEFEIDDIKIVRKLYLGAMNWMTRWYSDKGSKTGREISQNIADKLLRIIIVK